MACAVGLSVEESSLVSRIQEGSRPAFEILFRAHYSDLCDFALRFVESPAIAEELVQDVFLRVWESRASWGPRGSVRGYLFKATRNRALNHIKHSKIERRVSSSDCCQSSGRIPSVEQQVGYFELESAVRGAVENLPKGSRRIFSMSRDQGLTYREIARRLDISVKTVETQMCRALRLLRQSLESFV